MSHEKLIGAAVAGIAVGATVHEHGKTGKFPLAAKALLVEIAAAVILLSLTIASNFKTTYLFIDTMTVMLFGVTFAWLVIHLARRALKATHPSNFPQFENRPVPELAREMAQTVGKPQMTERYIVMHHDPTKRQIIVVPGHPDRICCQADGNWYDWDQHDGAYVFSEK